MSNKSRVRRNRNKRCGERELFKHVLGSGLAHMYSTIPKGSDNGDLFYPTVPQYGELKPVKECGLEVKCIKKDNEST